MIEGAAACHRVTLLQRHLVANFADVGMGLTVKSSSVTAHEQEMTGLDVGDVMGSRLCWRWKLYPQSCQLLFDFHGTLLIRLIAHQRTVVILDIRGKNDKRFSYQRFEISLNLEY